MENQRQKRDSERATISLDPRLFDAAQIMARRRLPTVARPFSAYIADLVLRDVQEEMRRLGNVHPSDALTKFLATAPELEAQRKLLRNAAEGTKSTAPDSKSRRGKKLERSSAASGKHGSGEPSESGTKVESGSADKSRKFPGE